MSVDRAGQQWLWEQFQALRDRTNHGFAEVNRRLDRLDAWSERMDEQEYKQELAEAKAKLEKAQEQLRRLETSAAPSTCSREVIERYRAQDFGRNLTGERVSVSPDEDEITLSCGHKVRLLVSVIDTMVKVNGTRSKSRCPQCAKEWLAKAAEEQL